MHSNEQGFNGTVISGNRISQSQKNHQIQSSKTFSSKNNQNHRQQDLNQVDWNSHHYRSADHKIDSNIMPMLNQNFVNRQEGYDSLNNNNNNNTNYPVYEVKGGTFDPKEFSGSNMNFNGMENNGYFYQNFDNESPSAHEIKSNLRESMLESKHRSGDFKEIYGPNWTKQRSFRIQKPMSHYPKTS